MLNNQTVDEMYEKLRAKLAAEAERVGSDIPFIPVGGHYRDLMMPGGLHWWCNGFWPGMLWQMYHATGDSAYREAAEAADDRLAPLLEEPGKLDHDVGFLFILSSLAEYLSTGSDKARERTVRAADILAGRFHEGGGFIEAWNPGTIPGSDTKGMMIADCMMNLSLLFKATEITGEGRCAEVAERHADTALRYLTRADGSAAHIARVDGETGRFMEYPSGQGYAPESAWSRGQSWILYGFTNAWRHTGKQEYLDAAERAAHYCISNLAVRNWLPVVDFRAPQDGRFDSTAGMVIASGLLELADAVREAKGLGDFDAELYREAAIRILRACDEKFNHWDLETDGIVWGASLRYHDDRMAGAAIIYGDYYLTEALLKLKGRYLPVW